MARTIGCIGCGRMGSAIMRGFAACVDKNDYQLCAYNRSPEKMNDLVAYDIKPMPDIASSARASDILIFAVKPGQMVQVLKEAATGMDKGKIAISVAAGFSLRSMREILGDRSALARCMPTTTALVRRGVFAICFDNETFPQSKKAEVLELFARIGCCLELPESKFTAYSALIGAGPAYVFAVMQGLSQAGITLGFSREECRKMLVELFSGSAQLAREQEKSFMDMRDDVCSPAGLTIAGVNVLDRAGLNGLLVEAVRAAEKRGLEMDG